ncbi:type VI secretion system baseplate subunit TssF [Dyella sp. 333MFSha]|uniref:type VI secretion system baseplate subunit TssF n=1 Tax=Dyella sp. 333MFSha TaxID=1798240 RepID=UPI000883ABC8|nr:type VI secretion system baseplate subunit TssF [Dyella sp. 333MFSha]SDG88742.1 type VI secretion system protein ImpG [Dyella sp. 333MFSha]
MSPILPYFQRELASLNAEAREFAERYPRVAAGLRLSENGSDDPHIERLLQSVAWLNARVARRLDDGYSGFAETLLEAIFPQYRRPFPSCAVARFDRGAFSGALERGVLIHAGPPGGTRFRFNTLFDVDTHAPDLSSARFNASGVFHTRAGTMYRGPYLDLRWDGDVTRGLRLFVDGDTSIAAELRDALGLGVTAVLSPDPDDNRYVLDGGMLDVVGLNHETRVLDDSVASHPGIRLLREFFAFPDKFGFFDLVLPNGTRQSDGSGRAILFLGRSTIVDGMDLRSVGPEHLLTRCAPLANVFRASAGASARSHAGSTLDIGARTSGYPVGGLLSIESVEGARPAEEGGAFDIPHFHAVRRTSSSVSGPYWVTAGGSEDTDAEAILFVDSVCEAIRVGFGVSVRMLCCDGDAPAKLVCGTPGARLYAPDAASGPEGRLITRPSAVARFRLGKEASWRLVSQLSMNQATLLRPDASALRELLRLYVPPGSVWGEQIVQSLVSIRQESVMRWLTGFGGIMPMRGTAIDLSIDVTQLVGIGMHALVHVLDIVFAQYVQINTFTELTLSSCHTGKELYSCKMRTGSGPLI